MNWFYKYAVCLRSLGYTVMGIIEINIDYHSPRECFRLNRFKKEKKNKNKNLQHKLILLNGLYLLEKSQFTV